MTQIFKGEIEHPDILAKLASFLPAKLARSARIEVVKLPSINDGLLIYLVTFHDNWMDPIIAYLKEEKLPEDKFKARNLILKIVRYVIIAETLYKRGFLMPYLRYV